jgi:uncharacterized SAM-binding protein YcdF (DUF218 family)
MTFFLRKLLGGLLMPLPALLAVGLIGWVLWMRGRRPRLARVMVGGSLILLAVLSLDPVSAVLGRGVQSDVPAFPGDSVAFVVVLGSGGVSDPTIPPGARLDAQGLYRLVEALRITNAQPWTTLVLSGYGGTDPVPNAEAYHEVARSLGFPEARMHIDARGRSTAEEAGTLAPLLRGHAFALVTSATHMPRALTLFRARGLDPIPAPTGHLVKGPQRWSPLDAIPGEESLRVTRQAWYETLGRIWVALRGGS